MTLLTMIVKMGEGLSKTCAIFFLTLLFSLPLGMIVALLRMSKNRDRLRHHPFHHLHSPRHAADAAAAGRDLRPLLPLSTCRWPATS